MSSVVAKIAVSAATYWIDRPYSYLIPDELESAVQVGKRVYVPFSRGNKICEGIVLAFGEKPKDIELKEIDSVLDSYPVLSPEQIQLAVFMRERFFCTIYDAVKAMLPVGLWFDDNGKSRVKDKFVEFAKLIIPGEEAAEIAESKKKNSPQQSALLSELAVFGELPSRDLLQFTGAARTSLKALEKKEYIEFEYREYFRRPEIFHDKVEPLPELNLEQNKAFIGISSLVDENIFSTALLKGVTGSGKTAVYIRIIDNILKNDKTAILLVPEIALTPQMLQTFSSYFGNDIAVLHSSLTPAERYDEWKRIKNKKAHLVIGTRSAVFAPVENLGIIIIDEEQESTYKSDNTPRYNAEDIAKYRCYKASCLLLLGSATPKIVTSYNANIGKYHLFTLNNRFNKMELPKVSIIDMKEELKAGNDTSLSSYLKSEIQKNIDNGEQSILFLNRRGANKLVTCGECGYIYSCPNCSVSLTYHSVNNRLMCHYCGYSVKPDSECPDCGGKLKYVGTGTQLVEKELHESFPDVEIMRMDTDVISRSVTHEQMFDRFRNEKIPIMIGTQMVTKGLNFENVTLVGVLSADQSLYSGDFKASERTFSLITQVIGRAGRGSKAGRAVIQTFTPENETIVQSANQDYESFYNSEIIIRGTEFAPPFSDILCVTVSGDEEDKVFKACEYVKRRLKFLLQNEDELELLGPTPLSVVKINNKYRYRINICCHASNIIRNAISVTIIECFKDKRFKGMSFYADTDPEN